MASARFQSTHLVKLELNEAIERWLFFIDEIIIYIRLLKFELRECILVYKNKNSL